MDQIERTKYYSVPVPSTDFVPAISIIEALTHNAEGLVSEKINSLGNISYHYNSRDLLYRMVQKVSPNTYSFTFTYNA
ncbi:MAG: hypothetical protein LLG16_00735, partial [Euryarchaeota archaeon]|nr:hypothetical protein [Euryarchaeota archaeon]